MENYEQNILRLFYRVCAQLSCSRFGRKFSVATSRSYRLQPNTVYSTRIRNFDHEDFRSFLLLFRQLVSESEPVYIMKVLKILGRYGDRRDQTNLKKIRAELQNVNHTVAGVSYASGEPLEIITPKNVRDTLFNGFFFHCDLERQEDFEKMLQNEPFTTRMLLHNVIFIYKQALRISVAIKQRSLVKN